MPYNPGNISRLTDWALNGTVPAVAKSMVAGGKEVETKKDKVEVTREVARRAK
jgi:hypothetical protein